MEIISRGEKQTESIGEYLARVISPGSVIALRGGLGMGKTAFTRGLARGLGYPGRVTSPTFTIVNEYPGGRVPIFHFDFYRLRDAAELFDIGWEDYLDRGGLCVVEWSEQIPEAFPAYTMYITLSRCHDDSPGESDAVRDKSDTVCDKSDTVRGESDTVRGESSDTVCDKSDTVRGESSDNIRRMILDGVPDEKGLAFALARDVLQSTLYELPPERSISL